jgi:dihydroorotase
MQTLTLARPDDFHLHLRDGAALASVLPASAGQFARALVMPNLNPPVVTVEQAMAYRARILAALPAGLEFTPLMTLYLTAQTTPEEIHKARESGGILAVKYYPAGATTHAERGVSAIERAYPVLEAMQEVDLPLCVHGEVAAPEVDIFDRERVFIEWILERLLADFPRLRIVLEHISTRYAAEFVAAGPGRLAATITPQHLLLNRNALLAGGLRPHHYCLPVVKREEDRRALLAAATSGNPRFFLGTDSAPHARTAKENDCGCAGVYSAPCALELYAEAFDSAGRLDRLPDFASSFGARFYGLPRNQGAVTLARERWRVPASLPYGDDRVVPLRGGSMIEWRLRVS